MNLQQIKYLITVVKVGSISQAAKDLYLSQSSVSNAIKSIELKYGTVIFDRTSKGVVLTRKGEELLIDLERILYYSQYVDDKYDKINIKDQSFCVSSQHHINSSEPFIKLFENLDNIKYRLGFLECKTQEILTNVEKGISDLGVLYYIMKSKSEFVQELRIKNLTFNHIAYSRLHIYLRKEHPLSKNTSIFNSELIEYPFVTYDTTVNSATIFTDYNTHLATKIIYANDRAAVYSILNSTDAYLIGSGYNNNPDIITIPIQEEGNIEMGWVVKGNFDLTPIAKEYLSNLKELF